MVLAVHTITPMRAVAVRDVRRVDLPGPVAPVRHFAVGRRVGISGADRRNAKLMALLEQVANIDPNFRELRRRRGEVFTVRNARGIVDLQKRGIADPELTTERKGAY